jgi:hypothetical protein
MSKRLRWMGNVGLMGEMRNEYVQKFRSENMKGRYH